MTRTMDTTTHANAEMRRAAHHRRVQEWRQSRPVVARVRKATPPDGFAGWWRWECTGHRRIGYGYCETHRAAVIVAASAARAFAAEADVQEALHEWRCPNCDATTRARMADR